MTPIKSAARRGAPKPEALAEDNAATQDGTCLKGKKGRHFFFVFLFVVFFFTVFFTALFATFFFDAAFLTTFFFFLTGIKITSFVRHSLDEGGDLLTKLVNVYNYSEIFVSKMSNKIPASELKVWIANEGFFTEAKLKRLYRNRT